MASKMVSILRKILKKIIHTVFWKVCIISLLYLFLDIFGIFTYLKERYITTYDEIADYSALYPNFHHLHHHQGYLLNPVNDLIYKFRIFANCEKIADGFPAITFLIQSPPSNIENRMAIRDTWGVERTMENITIRRIFVMGITTDTKLMKNVKHEAKKFNDILQVDKRDNSFNNTLASMHWALRQCNRSIYYIFVNDKYYISLKNVLQFINHPALYPNNELQLLSTEDFKNKSISDRLYAGVVVEDSRPVRRKFSKWYVSLDDYPYDRWPPYIKNNEFIISQGVLIHLYHTSLYTKFLKFHDIYFGLVAMKIRVTLTNIENFYVTPPQYTGPNSYRYVIAANGFNPQDMINIWNECHQAGFA